MLKRLGSSRKRHPLLPPAPRIVEPFSHNLDPKRKWLVFISRRSQTIGVSQARLRALATRYCGQGLFSGDNLPKNNPPLLKISSLILRHLPKISTHQQVEPKGRKAFPAYLLGQGDKPRLRHLCRV